MSAQCTETYVLICQFLSRWSGFQMYQYVPVCTGMYRYVPVCNCVYGSTYRDWYHDVRVYQPECHWNPTHLDRIWQNGVYVSEHSTDMYVHVYTSSWIHERHCVCTWYIHVHELIHFYVYGTYLYMNKYVCMYMVHTSL
jgi:hypothetical protein